MKAKLIYLLFGVVVGLFIGAGYVAYEETNNANGRCLAEASRALHMLNLFRDGNQNAVKGMLETDIVMATMNMMDEGIANGDFRGLDSENRRFLKDLSAYRDANPFPVDLRHRINKNEEMVQIDSRRFDEYIQRSTE